jgi:DNA repair protein RadC
VKPSATKETDGLRRHILTDGPEVMSDMELLGIVMDSPSIARAVARHTQNWREADREQLGRIPGFKLKRIAQLLAMQEISVRISSNPVVYGQPICCSDDVSRAYHPRLAGRKQEHFLVLALDNKNQVIAEHEVARGSLNSVNIEPREVFRALIRDGAARGVALHNHPSGDPKPSAQDSAVCHRLCQAGTLIGIELLDFIIVGSRGITSFRDMGILPTE